MFNRCHTSPAAYLQRTLLLQPTATMSIKHLPNRMQENFVDARPTRTFLRPCTGLLEPKTTMGRLINRSPLIVPEPFLRPPRRFLTPITRPDPAVQLALTTNTRGTLDPATRDGVLRGLGCLRFFWGAVGPTCWMRIKIGCMGADWIGWKD